METKYINTLDFGKMPVGKYHKAKKMGWIMIVNGRVGMTKEAISKYGVDRLFKYLTGRLDSLTPLETKKKETDIDEVFHDTLFARK